MEERTVYKAIGHIKSPVDEASITTNEQAIMEDLELSRWHSRF